MSRWGEVLPALVDILVASAVATAVIITCIGAREHVVDDARTRADLEIARAEAAAASSTLAKCQETLNYCLGITKHLAGGEP